MPRILDKVGHFGPDICTTWHSFSMWNESFFLPWAKKFYKAHQSPVYLIPLIRVSRNALDVSYGWHICNMTSQMVLNLA